MWYDSTIKKMYRVLVMKKKSNPIMTDIITRYIESEVTGVEKINQFERKLVEREIQRVKKCFKEVMRR